MQNLAATAPDLERLRPQPEERLRRNRRRFLADRLVRYAIGAGGVAVIVAIVLIFVYLFSVVLPLFRPAALEPQAQYDLAGAAAEPLLLAVEEQNEVALRLGRDGVARFFALADGSERDRIALDLPPGAGITAFREFAPTRGLFVAGLSDGNALVARHHYEVSYPEGVRTITPQILYPLGGEAFELDAEGRALVAVTGGDDENGLTLAGVTADGRLLFRRWDKSVSFLDDTVTLEPGDLGTLSLPFVPRHLLITPDQRSAYLADEAGKLVVVDLSDAGNPLGVQQLAVTAGGARLTHMSFLLGGISVLVGDERGGVSQWFPVRQEDGRFLLTRVREFEGQRAVVALSAEQRRKGFLVADEGGAVHIYHTTARRYLGQAPVLDGRPLAMALSPRADALLVEGPLGRLHHWRVDNQHPEVSWAALWGEVWYESFPQPEYLWQSSAANNDFEPKFSLTPLTFGSIKAAFYAMLVAMPLAIMGAIFTAYFMAPRMRRMVKPSIEVMEALPTVILGFLAGLWFAPFAESNLPGIFAVLVLLPPVILAFAFLWTRLPVGLRLLVPEGWQAAVLVPVVVLVGWACIAASPVLEQLLFGGDMRAWLNRNGIGFDQRNALVVGVTMGFAVIPTIFSISEDAIFSVPKHLTQGSLALGATPWQTLVRVVLPTASPGLFSAVMIGLGRAVGETMIVLMATGNTPVMDFSIFEGMRTLAANIAVELPESEVDSSHYRILFLAALVLFMLTFLFNTLAEIIRQRLRNKYSRI